MKSDTGFDLGIEELADPKARLVKQWADYSRWSALYPESNARVGTAQRAFLGGVAERLARRPPGAQLVLTSLDGRFHLDRTPIEVPVRGSLEWLQTRLVRSGLAGISLTAAVDAASLHAFTRRLIGNWGRAQQGGIVAYEKLWPDAYPGLEPIGRRLEAAGTVATSFDDEHAELIARLAGDERVQHRIAAYRSAIDARAGPEEPRVGVPLLEQIVASLPGSATGTFDVARRLTEQVLDALRDGVAGGDGLNQLELERRVEGAGRAIFVRGGTRRVSESAETDEPTAHVIPEPETPELEPLGALAGCARLAGEEPEGEVVVATVATPASIHRCDDDYGDDLDAFLDEQAHLETLAPEGATIDVSENPLEPLDVYLELICGRPRAAGDLPAIREGTRRLYRADETAVTARIRQLVEALRTLNEDTAVGRLARFLRDEGLAFLLRLGGAVEMSRTIHEFPRLFGAYLDTVDFNNPADVLELDDVVARIGVDRILAASDAVEAAFDPELASRILESDSPALRPVVHVLLERSQGRLAPAAFEYLRRLRLVDDAAALLWVTDELERVPLDYLLDLCRPTARGGYSGLVHERAGELLRRFVRETAGDESQAKRRAYAIQRLGAFDGDATRRCLREIAEAKKLLWMAAEPPDARQAAANALDRLKRSAGDV